MAAANFTPEIMTKIKQVTAMNYKDQAIFYLNAFWAEGAEKEAETVWDLVVAFSKEDHVKGKEGCELNAVQAFNVLQKRNQTLTALELKKQLRTVDIDANGEMALAEYLLFINSRDPIAFITNPQGEIDPQVLAECQEKIAKLNASFDELQVNLAAATKAEEESKAKEAAANDAASKAAAAEAELKKIEEEARVIEMEIKAQEQAKINELARLEALTQDQTVGIVKRNMAVQQLAALKGEDSLPLQKAKLTQEAVVRRLKKATDLAKVETDKANDAAKEASDARLASEKATQQVQAQLKIVEEEIAEAEKELNKLKMSSGSPQGLLWWEKRAIEEKKKSLPTRMW